MRILPTSCEVLALADEIGIPFPALTRLSHTVTPAFIEEHGPYCKALTQPQSAAEAWKALEAQLSDSDTEGMKLLSAYLTAACLTRQAYHAAGAADGVFVNTMKCFTRFLTDEQTRTGSMLFNRGYWAWRHVSCRLFRLGTLEFEYDAVRQEEPPPDGIRAGSPVLFVHIPSDAKLTHDDLAASYREAARFFEGEGAAFCTQGTPEVVLCNTWLLSPALRELLPETSGILRFAQDYTVYAAEPDDESFYLWLFQGKKPPEPLPTATSLQRRVVAYLQRGGRIGAAHGCRPFRSLTERSRSH